MKTSYKIKVKAKSISKCQTLFKLKATQKVPTQSLDFAI